MHYKTQYKYHHFSQEERVIISVYFQEWLSIRKIAQKLNRSHSSIVREINRNWKDLWFFRIEYNPTKAHEKYHDRLYKRNYNHRILVKERWKRKWLYDNLKDVDGKIWIDELLWRYELEKWKKLCATSTAYNWIRDVWWEMEWLLKHKSFWYHKKWDRRKYNMYYDIETISDRDIFIQNREEIWHWECDTIVSGKDGKWWLVTMIDRKTRLEIIKKVPNLKWTTVFKAMYDGLKWKIVKSLTIDNWKEFSKIRRFKKLWVKIYRCHAYSSREKWTNERHNWLIRWWIPKGYDISLIDEVTISKIEKILNHKPRKILWYRTPFESYYNLQLKYFN